MKILSITIESVSPLLTNNPAGMFRQEAPKGVTVPKYPSAEEEAESLAYRLPNRQLYAKAEWFRAALLIAARGRKIGKKSAPMIIAGAVFNTPTLTCPLVDPKTNKPITTYEIDSRRVVLPGKKGIIRCRPKIDRWKTTVELEYDEEIIANPELIVNLLNDAGRYPAVGDYRTGKGGSFGRFTAKASGVIG